MDAGYELAIPLTAEEISEKQAQMAQVEAERIQAIEALRKDYRDAVAQFCTIAGVPVVSKFESSAIMRDLIMQANANGNTQQIMGLTQLSIALKDIIDELRRKDGDDAWLRI